MSDQDFTPPPPSGESVPPPPPGAGYNAPPPPNYGMVVPSGPTLANWGQRVGGYIIDALLTLPGAILTWLGSATVTVQPDGTLASSGGSGALVVLGWLVSLAIVVWNRWLRGGRTGQTVGRQVLNIKMVDAVTGQPIGPGRAFARDLCHILDSLACYLGWLWPIWDSKRQTFADKLMNTVVVNA